MSLLLGLVQVASKMASGVRLAVTALALEVLRGLQPTGNASTVDMGRPNNTIGALSAIEAARAVYDEQLRAIYDESRLELADCYRTPTTFTGQSPSEGSVFFIYLSYFFFNLHRLRRTLGQSPSEGPFFLFC